MTGAIAHRGPDAEGRFFNHEQTLQLGHRRLSIIDLSESANQPMFSVSERYVVVFNGEIYNFKQLRRELEASNYEFRTASDTEVILNAFDKWGRGFAERLQGMFAIALFDRQKSELWLARDRFGKKPLYIYNDTRTFAFASEIKALKCIPSPNLSVDRTALSQFLLLGYIPQPRSAWTSITKFPAASVARVDRDCKMEISTYWNPLDNKTVMPVSSEEAAIKQFESILSDAVQQRLISDVPLGALLSGGTDSSLVCAIASKHVSQKLKTFNIGFDNEEFNESHYATRVAEKLGTDHHTFILKEKEAVELTEAYLDHFDEPFADTSAIPTMLVSEKTRQQVKVALTGDGGDELFLGYGRYAWATRIEKWKTIARPLAMIGAPFHEKAGKAHAMFAHVETSGKRAHIFSQEQGFFSTAEIAEMTGVAPDFVYNDPPELAARSDEEKQAYFDLNYYLRDDLLVKVDRASMRYALECRCPLLDPHVANFALQLPMNLKVNGGVRKFLLKKALERYLPHDLVYRRKWGFSVPLAQWLQGDLSYLAEKYLSPKVVSDLNFVNATTVSKLHDRFKKGDRRLVYKIWALIAVHRWLVKSL